MIRGYDERCAADLANVAEGRGLSRDVAAWLARVVTGAVRPNRDKPLWDLAHALAAVAHLTGAGSGRDLVDLALDPRLATGGHLEERLAGASAGPAATDAGGLVLALGPVPWRTSWHGAARLLALGEFVLTAEDLAQFAQIKAWLDDLATAPSTEAVELLVKRLTRLMHAYRNAHLPLAPLEKRFRSILGFLGGRSAFTDDDILDFWRAELGSGGRPGFRTVAEHLVTFEAALGTLSGLDGLRAAASLDAAEGLAERLDASLADLVGAEPATALVALLADLPDGPKILTGAERDDLADLLRLDPFHRTRPLTVLRAASFGRVQSGIANRLRRGGGGADIAERASCAEAEPYAALAERIRDLAAHLRRMLAIAAALRLSPEDTDERIRAALALAEADLKRVRRAGFDADRAALAARFAAVDESLIRLSEEIAALMRAVEALDARRHLPEVFSADRAAFAQALTRAYAEEAVR